MDVYEIAPGLYQSGTLAPSARYRDRGITAVVCLESAWHPVVLDDSLYLRFPIEDAPLPDRRTEDTIKAVATLISQLRDAGHSVLVHCSAGLNRSGLVSAAALIASGMSAKEAVEAVRKARGPNALFNTAFVRWLEQTWS